MATTDWENLEVKYDYLSVMHYPSYGFATGSDPTMTHIDTGAPVQKPRRTRVSTLDMIQLQKMYSEFCPNPLPTVGILSFSILYSLNNYLFIYFFTLYKLHVKPEMRPIFYHLHVMEYRTVPTVPMN